MTFYEVINYGMNLKTLINFINIVSNAGLRLPLASHFANQNIIKGSSPDSSLADCPAISRDYLSVDRQEESSYTSLINKQY